jgi:hypothetical protein
MSDLRSKAAMARQGGATPGPTEEEAVQAIRAATAGPPAPDVADSGITADMDVPVHVAWSRVMRDVQWLGKNRQGDKYMYRGIDDVMNLVGPAERKHGVFVMPTGIEPSFTTINTRSGAAMNYCRAVVHFTRDTEYGVQHEIAGPKAPTPDEYAAMILDERVTLQRLKQIKDELTADRAMGAATVDVFGGEPVQLIDLVNRVGKAKQQGAQG